MRELVRLAAALIVVIGFAGCGGGGGVQEGVPPDVKEAEANFEKEFRQMQGDMGKEMTKKSAP